MHNVISQYLEDKSFVVYSAHEAAKKDGAGFWSNSKDWVELDQATVFSEQESRKFRLPVCAGGDACYLQMEDATAVDMAHPRKALQRALSNYLNSMRQDDAVGAVYALSRDDSSRQMVRMRPDQFDESRVFDYEFVLLDGGNTAGDLWKCAFFPGNLVFQLVDEASAPPVRY